MKYDFDELLKTTMNPDVKPSTELNQRILQQNREDNIMNRTKNKRISKNITSKIGRIAAATCIGILAMGGGALAAVHLWNPDIAQKWGLEQEDSTMQELNQQGYSAIPTSSATEDNTLSVTDQDITVTVLQTVADEHCAYIYFEAKFGEQYQPVQNNATEISDTGLAFAHVNLTSPSGIDFNYCGGIEKIKDDHTIIYSYQLMPCDESFSDTTLNMSISSFTMDNVKMDDNPTVLAEGNWNLSWNLSNGSTKRVYDIDKVLTLGEYNFIVKSLEISPLSYKVYIENSDNISLSEIQAVVSENGEQELSVDENDNLVVLRYVEATEETADDIINSLPSDEALIPLDTVNCFYLKNQKFEELDGMGASGFEDDTKYYTNMGTFSKILNLDELTGFQLAGQKIVLTDCTYETVDCFQ